MKYSWLLYNMQCWSSFFRNKHILSNAWVRNDWKTKQNKTKQIRMECVNILACTKWEFSIWIPLFIGVLYAVSRTRKIAEARKRREWAERSADFAQDKGLQCMRESLIRMCVCWNVSRLCTVYVYSIHSTVFVLLIDIKQSQIEAFK